MRKQKKIFLFAKKKQNSLELNVFLFESKNLKLIRLWCEAGMAKGGSIPETPP